MPELTTSTGDISARTTMHAVADLLENGKPYMVFENIGKTVPMPKNKGVSPIFRRYSLFGSEPEDLQLEEGVTPVAEEMDSEDYPATLRQYGKLAKLTDVVQDTHEDPILKEMTKLLGQNAAELVEKVRFGVLKGGTNVYYTGTAAARGSVNAAMTKAVHDKVLIDLIVNRAAMVTETLRSTPAYGTQNIPRSFFGVCHPYFIPTYEAMDNFKKVEDYGSLSRFENEFGSLGRCRMLFSDVVQPWADAGGAKALSGTTMRSTSGTNCDVFPILYFGANAFGTVPLKGYKAKNADGSNKYISPVQLMVLNPNVPRGGDELGQRGSIGYKLMMTACILHPLWMARVEAPVAA
ncbi:MAG: N4-gp56 family major capsid protein [Thermodesulfobacteriota bacterium]|nr:N4-gp56 family major capsid protein [Thermodesulfobacteriota bacterium]